MTLRARPVARRRGRAGWDSGDRRNSLINAGFFATIGLAILLLVGYTIFTWYDDHFGAAATVNGKVITKDEVRNRLAIETFRLDYIGQRIQTLMASGHISQSDGAQQLDFLNQRKEQLTNLTVERLVDNTLMATLAAENGVTVDDADVTKQIESEATTSEQRHVWMIEIEPAVNPDTGEAGEAEKRAALVRAQQALGRLSRGESWEDVARTVSDSGLAPQSGDLGWLSKDSGYEESFMDAVFASELNKPTGIVEGKDDIFRIGRATEMTPAQRDTTFEDQLEAAGIVFADYRVAAQGDALRQKLSDKVVADMSKPGVQRHVLEIYLPEPNPSSVGVEPGVKVRHIVFAPNDDADKADDLPDTDPAWVAAKAEAEAAYATLKAHPDQFDAMARERSDEPSAKETGGKQPWYYASSSVDQAFKNAILAEGLTPGQLLAPVKSAFGWHVIQFMRPLGDGEASYLNSLLPSLTDEAKFRQAAKDTSEGPEAGDGGDIGWIAKGQLEDALDKAVFSTALGANSTVIESTSGGTYLLRVLAEETREPTQEQLDIFKENGFSYWYTGKKEDADITYPLAASNTTG